MEGLGGKGTLRQIYSEVNQIERTPYPSIRRTIYQHSSECDIYENKYSDIFYAPRGMHHVEKVKDFGLYAEAPQ